MWTSLCLVVPLGDSRQAAFGEEHVQTCISIQNVTALWKFWLQPAKI